MKATDPGNGVKIWTPHDVDVKAGRVRAAFAVIGNRDRVGDVLLKDAIPDGITVPIGSWNHGGVEPGHPPIGMGKVSTDGHDVVVTAEFFETQAAKDTLHVLERLGEHARWSFSYFTLESEYGTHQGERVNFLKKLDLLEISAVTVPANPATRTLSVADDAETPADIIAIGERLRQEAGLQEIADHEYARFVAQTYRTNGSTDGS